MTALSESSDTTEAMNFRQYLSESTPPDFSQISHDKIAFVVEVFDKCLAITRHMKVRVTSEQNYDESRTQIGDYFKLAGNALCNQRHLVEVTLSASGAMHVLTGSPPGESGQYQNDSDYLGRVANVLCDLQTWPFSIGSQVRRGDERQQILDKIDNLTQALQAASNLLCPPPPILVMPPVDSTPDASA